CITGATSGIGEACALTLAEQGYHLILLARRANLLDSLKTKIQATYGVHIKTLCVDVRDREDLTYQLEGLQPDWKAVDILINNAGLSQGLEPIHEGDPEDWDRMIDTNVKGLLYVTKIVSNWMVA